MPSSSYAQSSFLGGEWSAYSQGAFDDPKYRSALAVCRNAYPLEEGCWTRRPGSRRLGTTRNGAQAILRAFHFQSVEPYILEFTDSHMRLWEEISLVLQAPKFPILGVTSANPGVFLSGIPHGLTTGDQIVFTRQDGDLASNAAPILNRQWAVTVIDTTHFTIADPVTGTAFNGSTINLANQTIAGAKIVDFTTPWTQAYLADGINVVQAIQGTVNETVILNPNTPPYTLSNTAPPTETTSALFSLAPITFNDGPYFDYVNDGSYVTPSGTSGIVTLVVSVNSYNSGTTYSAGDTVVYDGVAYTSLQDSNIGHEPDTSSAWWEANISVVSINEGQGFLSTDVGRAVRLFSEPADWSSSTAYAVGTNVKYAGGYWTALAANTNVEPDTDPTNWAISTTAATWTWGRITAVNSSENVSIQLIGGNLLYEREIVTFQLGLYSETTGYPTCGCYHEGRLWLAGAQPNRMDASAPNDIFNFSPTGPDGTVADSNAIAEELNASEVCAIFWLLSDHQGVITGTKAGEWLTQASALNDPLTPTSIQTHRVTKFGCDPVQPVQTPLSNVFVQRYGKKLIEYICDVYSGKFSGTNVAIKAKHLTASGIAEIAYQQEATPVVWARMNDGSLAGMTYRRDSPFGTTPASFSGWHRHDLGSGRIVESIQTGPSQDGDLDSLFLVTNDTTANVRWVEVLTDLFDEDTPIEEAWFVDSGQPPVAADISGSTITLYGFEHLAGDTVSVWGLGLDLGDYTVSATGTITLTLGTPPLFTQALLDQITAEGNIFGDQGLVVNVASSEPSPPNLSTAYAMAPLTGSYDANVMSVNFDENLLIVTKGGEAGSAAGWYKFNIATGGQEEFYSATTVLAGFGSTDNWVGKTIVGDSGAIYGFHSDSNQGYISRFDPNTFAVEATSSHNAPNNSGIPNTMVTLDLGGNEVLLYCGSYSTNGTQAYNGSDMSLIFDFSNSVDVIQGAYRTVCKGPSYSDGDLQFAGFFMIACDSPVTSVGTDPVYFYQGSLYTYNLNTRQGVVTVNGLASINLLATITPADIAPSIPGVEFTQYPNVGCMFDATDNTLITFFFLTSSGVNYTYMTKLNPADGSIVWNVPMQFPSGGNVEMSNFRIKYGRLAVWNGKDPALGADTSTVYWIDTATGETISTQTINGVIGGGSVWDVYTGRFVVAAATYSAVTGCPAAGNAATVNNFQGLISFGSTTPTPVENYFAPFVVGYTYTSQGQLLRPIQPQEAGAANGPALGKTRRSHMYSALLANTQGISVGTDFTTMHAMPLKSPGGTTYAANALFSGVVWDTLEDKYSFNSQPAWQISRPYPATVLMVEAFLQTQDRG